MRRTRMAIVACVVVVGGLAAAPVVALEAQAATAGDIAVIGERTSSSRLTSWFDPDPAGPVAGARSAHVDSASATVTVAVDDPMGGAAATLTMASSSPHRLVGAELQRPRPGADGQADPRGQELHIHGRDNDSARRTGHRHRRRGGAVGRT